MRLLYVLYWQSRLTEKTVAVRIVKTAVTVRKAKKKVSKILYLLLIAIGIYLLQIFFCKIKYKWVGLLLPIGFFINSIIQLFDEIKLAFSVKSDYTLIMTTALIFFIYNIPTIILLFVFGALKKKIKL